MTTDTTVTDALADAIPTVDVQASPATALVAGSFIAGVAVTAGALVLIRTRRAKKAAEAVETVVTD